MLRESIEYSNISPRNVRPLHNFKVTEKSLNELRSIGFDVSRFIESMDSLQPTITTATMTTPLQFLQTWLPGLVGVQTAPRKIDDLVGISTTGNWEDEEIVQGIQELTGLAQLYGDITNVPFDSWNVNFNVRTVVRFEQGLRVGLLEEARASRMNVSSSGNKRNSAAKSLEIQRNLIGFYGYNSGNNLTYGFLTDPNLPNYMSVSIGGGGSTQWSTKPYLEIVGDLLTMYSQLRSQSQDAIDPYTTPITLALATDVVDYLSVVPQFGNSVKDWINENYPKTRIVSAPELDQANGGENVAYMYAESVDGNADGASTDDGRTFIQVVPAKFMMLGVQKLVKGYEESYANATAGVMVKRPFAVTRWTGL
jgi:hypothetical protein